MDYTKLVRTIPDHPKTGIMFRDVTTLFGNARGWSEAIRDLAGVVSEWSVHLVAGIEARGFVVGSPLAIELGVGFVPVRKSGKLPAPTFRRDYELEYGRDCIEVHQDAIQAGQRVLVVDDLVATGGTALAAVQLVHAAGATVAGAAFLVELPELGGSEKLRSSGVQVFSLMSFSGH